MLQPLKLRCPSPALWVLPAAPWHPLNSILTIEIHTTDPTYHYPTPALLKHNPNSFTLYSNQWSFINSSYATSVSWLISCAWFWKSYGEYAQMGSSHSSQRPCISFVLTLTLSPSLNFAFQPCFIHKEISKCKVEQTVSGLQLLWWERNSSWRANLQIADLYAHPTQCPASKHFHGKYSWSNASSCHCHLNHTHWASLRWTWLYLWLLMVHLLYVPIYDHWTQTCQPSSCLPEIFESVLKYAIAECLSLDPTQFVKSAVHNIVDGCIPHLEELINAKVATLSSMQAPKGLCTSKESKDNGQGDGWEGDDEMKEAMSLPTARKKPRTP